MVTLPVSWLASRSTSTSRLVYVVIEVSVTGPTFASTFDVGEAELVVEAFLDLRDLAALARIHRRLRGRERIAEDVVDVDARIAVGLELLVHDARRDREILGRLDQPREARAALLCRC